MASRTCHVCFVEEGKSEANMFYDPKLSREMLELKQNMSDLNLQSAERETGNICMKCLEQQKGASDAEGMNIESEDFITHEKKQDDTVEALSGSATNELPKEPEKQDDPVKAPSGSGTNKLPKKPEKQDDPVKAPSGSGTNELPKKHELFTEVDGATHPWTKEEAIFIAFVEYQYKKKESERNGNAAIFSDKEFADIPENSHLPEVYYHDGTESKVMRIPEHIVKKFE